MNNMKCQRNLLTHKSRIVKIEAKKLQKLEFCAKLLVLMVLVGIFSLSLVISSLMDSALIRSTGEISTKVTAKSGSAKDIQAAIDRVVSTGGVGNVYIPAGTFNFVEVGEPWITVNIPAGVNLFGAPTERYPNGSVVEWKTVLVMPYDVPSNDYVGSKSWFYMNGNGDPSKPSRFSDIKLVGYRDIDPNSTSMHIAIAVFGVIDFRIDHNYFRHTTSGIGIYSATDNGPVRGVIDHNRFINEYGTPVPYATRTIDYGIMPYRTPGSTYWDSNIYNVVGHYTDYTVFIEDNYFSRWRHSVSSINGMHYVFRHNIIEDDFGYGSVDGHGTYTNVGTRAMEFYDNQFLDPNYLVEAQPNVVNWRGGGGVFFNNTIRDYYYILYFTDEGPNPKTYPGSSDSPVYIWNNTYLPGTHYASPVFVYQPHTGVTNGPMPNYTPYPYPHPLTFEAAP